MTNDTRTSDDIERDIVNERAQMSDSINNLQKKFSVDAIMDDIGNIVRDQTGDLGRVVSQTVGRNPAAVALVGVGLAWLLLGQDRSRSAQTDDGRGVRRTRHRANRTQANDNGTRGNFDSWTGEDSAQDRSFYDQTPDGEDDWYRDQADQWQTDRARSYGDQGRAATSRAKDAAGGMVEAVQGAASSVGDAVSSAASSVGQTASDLTARLSHGLEGLSEEARSRVVAARQAAHDARVASTAAMKKGAQAATNLFEDQPLVVGALAVALGAAVGSILPHTTIEDETLGASRDQLFAEAQALFRKEREKATAALRMAAADAKDEVRNVGSELSDLLPEGKGIADVVVDRAADVVSRVYDRATGEVEHVPSDRSQS